MDRIKKLFIPVTIFTLAGCADMVPPDYSQIKLNPHYDECREFADKVYKNGGYVEFVDDWIVTMNEKKARTIVSGCVVAMEKGSVQEIKTDINLKAARYGLLAGMCTSTDCEFDSEQELKAYTLGSYYSAFKKFPEQLKTSH